MNSSQKEYLQTLRSHVPINKLVLVSTIVLFLTCSSLKRTSCANENVILNKEIEIAESFSNDNKVILVLNENGHLISFIKEFSVLKSNSNIKKEAFNSLFNNDTLLDFYKQLENNNLDFNAIQMSSNTKVRNSNKKSNSTSDFLKNSSDYEVILSMPFISKNKKFAIVSFSRGFIGSKEGGISIYEKNDSTWIKIDTIDSWIE